MLAKDTCECRSIREDFLQDVFVKIYNNLLKEYDDNSEELMKLIKNVISNYSYENEINKLKDDIEKNKKKILNLLDMKLENCIDMNTYLIKESELKNKIQELENKLMEIEKANVQSQNISKRLEVIKTTLNKNEFLKEFDKDLFNALVDCIIIGDFDESGNKNPNVIRFVLNTGKEIKEEFDICRKLHENDSKEVNGNCNCELPNDNKDNLLSLDNYGRLWICIK